MGTALSLLFIEVESYRVVVMAHPALAVTKSWEVQPLESLLRECAKRRWGSFEPVSFASCTPFARKRGTASNIAKHSVWALDYIGPK